MQLDIVGNVWAPVVCPNLILKAYSPSHLSSPQSLTVLTATAVAALGVP